MNNKLKVWCVYWGDKYDKAYVYALRDMVNRYLSIEHDFICITTERFDGIKTRNPTVSYSGWWQKIGLFAPQLAQGAPSLYFDLDVVIVGNIDYLVDYTQHAFAAPANWAQSGHGGIQSSVMAWSGRMVSPYHRFNYRFDQHKYYGDQEFLTDMLGDDWVKLPGIGSYKYHCRQTIPEGINVIAFHGKPDPHEVTDQWILPYTRTLHSHINADTVSGCGKVS